MKKILGIVIALVLLVMPVFTFAAETIDISQYKSAGLTDVLSEERIARDFKDYKEGSNKVNIYMFRGSGCGYCQAFLKFLNSITEEYGKYFNLVAFETWNNSDNNDLLTTISTYLGETATGVPYIIIGDQVFPGYSSTYDDGIKAAITNLYKEKPEDRYDVFEKYNEYVTNKEKEEASATSKPIIWNFIIVSVATIIIICVINSAKKEILNTMRIQRRFGNQMNEKIKKRRE